MTLLEIISERQLRDYIETKAGRIARTIGFEFELEFFPNDTGDMLQWLSQYFNIMRSLSIDVAHSDMGRVTLSVNTKEDADKVRASLGGAA